MVLQNVTEQQITRPALRVNATFRIHENTAFRARSDTGLTIPLLQVKVICSGTAQPGIAPKMNADFSR